MGNVSCSQKEKINIAKAKTIAKLYSRLKNDAIKNTITDSKRPIVIFKNAIFFIINQLT